MHLIFDFDGTITESDTIGVLTDIAIDFQASRAGDSRLPGCASASAPSSNITPKAEETRQRLASRWAAIVASYEADYDAHVAAYAPSQEERTTAEAEVAFQRSLRAVETRSVGRVEAAVLFRGFGRDGTKEEGFAYGAGRSAVRDGQVRVRRGFAEIVRCALDGGGRADVISVNWDAGFVRGVISGVLGPEDASRISVHANRIDGQGRITDCRRKGRKILTSEDKIGAMKDAVAPCERQDETDGKGEQKTVYFGDSGTDLECLLAGPGVILAADERSKLLRTMKRIGESVPHILTVGRDYDGIVWARNFEEVMQSGFAGISSPINFRREAS